MPCADLPLPLGLNRNIGLAPAFLSPSSTFVSIDEPDNPAAAPGVTLLIPAYNEENGVEGVISQARQALAAVDGLPPDRWEVLVIDDGSADATADKASQAGARVIRHRENLGYGAALKTGLRRARFDTILITDADSTYPMQASARLLAMLKDCDMAVGARTGNDVNIPLERRPAKWVLKMTAQFLAGRRITDLNSGLRAFRRADALRFMSLYPSGFSFTTTITLAYLSSDLLIHYLPIDYHPRTGRSKLRPIRDTKNLFLTVVRSILFFNPLRVCIPAGLALLAAALVVSFFRDAHGRMFDGTITILVVCAMQILIVGFLADILSRLRR
jgi:glycosyltransferase involved in cell wall biosynthesis